jgi:hypothetical protein
MQVSELRKARGIQSLLAIHERYQSQSLNRIRRRQLVMLVVMVSTTVTEPAVVPSKEGNLRDHGPWRLR